MELRHYLLDSGYSGANGGSYLGVALLQDGNGEAYVGVTPGMKLTLSALSPSDSVLMEPYIGLSYPLTKEIDGGEWEFPDTPYVTLGFRVVFRHLATGDG